jgi:hypothetical protein
MFINYFSSSERESAFNLKAARLIIGVYAIWKLASLRWLELVRSPLQPYGFYSFFYPPSSLEPLIIGEVAVAILCLGSLALSYRVKMSSFISAVIIAHLSGLLQPLTIFSGSYTFLPIVFALIFLGMYEVEGLRDHSGNYQLKPLKWLILFLGIYYFSAGMGKIFSGDVLQWITPQDFERTARFTGYVMSSENYLAGILAQYDLLLYLGQILTILLEVVFLLAILVGISVTPFFVALAGMHVAIFLFFGINFLENLILFSIFMPWDSIKRRTVEIKNDLKK